MWVTRQIEPCYTELEKELVLLWNDSLKLEAVLITTYVEPQDQEYICFRNGSAVGSNVHTTVLVLYTPTIHNSDSIEVKNG